MTLRHPARRTEPQPELWLALTEVPGTPRVWGMAPGERLRRMLRGRGLAGVLAAGDAWPTQGRVLLARGDVVVDDSVVDGLLAEPGTGVSDAAGNRVLLAHVAAADAAEAWHGLGAAPAAWTRLPVLAPRAVARRYRGALRKRADPVCRTVAPGEARAAEREVYGAAYKGVTDFITKWVWPEPAFHATRACVRLGLTPNAVTLIGFALMLAALGLFWSGHLGWGLLAAWPMTFLDTVDGKLARVTQTASFFGNMLDHITDILHPPAWYAAWAAGAAAAGAGLPPGWFGPVVAVMVAGYTLGRLAEGWFELRHGMDVHIWRPFDSAFRLITARRNPNLLILTASWLAGIPAVGLLAITAWHLISDAVYALRLTAAERARARGAPPVSWLRAAA